MTDKKCDCGTPITYGKKCNACQHYIYSRAKEFKSFPDYVLWKLKNIIIPQRKERANA